MLHQDTQTKLSEYGFDVSKLIEAITSEDEVSLDVPELYTEKGHTKDDLTIFGKNRFEEGKKAMSEIMAKSYKEKFGLDIEGKDLDKVVEAYGEKRFSEAQPSEDLKQKEADFKALQLKIQELTKEKESLASDYEGKLFSIQQNTELSKLIPKEVAIPSEKVVALYKMDRELKSLDGRTVPFKDGEPIKDDLLNPVSVDLDFKSWLDTSGLIARSGTGQKDSDGGSSTANKFKSLSDFMTYAEQNNIEPMSEEGQKILSERKANEFSYD